MPIRIPTPLPEAYTTHKNYLQALNRLTQNVQLTYSDSVSRSPIPGVTTKRRLIELTRRSLDAEIEVRRADVEYAAAALPWIPAKVYYLLYYHSLTLEYLICCDNAAFGRGHTVLVDCFTAYLKNGRLSFSENILNQTFTIEELLSTTQASATQLRRATDDATLFKMLMKNIAKHCLEDEKRKRKWKTRTAVGKAAMQVYCQKKISIFHHPLIMRHRTNYKNVDFIDSVPDNELANYFDSYIDYGNNLAIAMEALIQHLTSQRI